MQAWTGCYFKLRNSWQPLASSKSTPQSTTMPQSSSRVRLLALSAACLLLPVLAQAAGTEPPVPVSSTTPPPAEPLPLAVPAAPGDVPLENPAPAATDAPVDSAQTSAPTLSNTVQVVAPQTPGTAPELLSPRRVQTGCSLRDYGAPVERGELASALFNTCSGFSLHKPTYLTLSYGDRYPGDQSELIFQFSGKAQLWDFGPGSLYFAYSQKSFLQVFNEKKSKAFRESNYNPEVFARVPKPFNLLPSWSFDAGFEHESNGEDLPNSRSWNRFYFAPYWVRGRQAVQLKIWQRLPENKDRAVTDPKRDDNPDIGSYYGYGELRYRQDFDRNNSLMDVMVRGNTNTGRGAVQVDFSTEIGPLGAVFLRVFNGYGESLIDYNRSVTRVGVGLALQR